MDEVSPFEPLVMAAKTEKTRLAGFPQSGQGASPLALIGCSFWKRCWQLSQTYS
jgi:hypothetical protein